jgi:hypothetical protein
MASEVRPGRREMRARMGAMVYLAMLGRLGKRVRQALPGGMDCLGRVESMGPRARGVPPGRRASREGLAWMALPVFLCEAESVRACVSRTRCGMCGCGRLHLSVLRVLSVGVCSSMPAYPNPKPKPYMPASTHPRAPPTHTSMCGVLT